MSKISSTVGRSLCLAAALCFASPAMAQAPMPGGAAIPLSTTIPDLVEQTANPPNEVGQDTLAASDAELAEARGGFVWFYYVIVGTQAVLRTCTRVDCARIGAAVFTSAAAARRYICQRNRRLRIC